MAKRNTGIGVPGRADVERVATETVTNIEKPIGPYRSLAEKRAVTQRNVTIFLATVVLVVNVLTCLKVFDIL